MKSTFALALLTFASTMPLFHPAAINPSYSVGVTIRPTASASPYQLLATLHTPPAHSCDVVITDISSHKALKKMHLLLIPGEKASQMAFASGNQIIVNALLSPTAERASWDVSMSRDGATFMSQKSDAELQVARVTK